MAPKNTPTRSRNQDGQLRRKRGDTLVGTLRGTYGEDFAAGVRKDAKLSTVLKRSGAASLNDFLKGE